MLMKVGLRLLLGTYTIRKADLCKLNLNQRHMISMPKTCPHQILASSTQRPPSCNSPWPGENSRSINHRESFPRPVPEVPPEPVRKNKLCTIPTQPICPVISICPEPRDQVPPPPPYLFFIYTTPGPDPYLPYHSSNAYPICMTADMSLPLAVLLDRCWSNRVCC